MPRRTLKKFLPRRDDELRSKWDRLMGGKKETAPAGPWSKKDVQEAQEAVDKAMEENYK